MRIAYLFDRPLPANETDSEQAMQTLSALARRGHHVTLVLPGQGAACTAESLQRYYQVQGAFEVLHVPNPLHGWSTGRKWWHAHRAPRLATLDVDLVYTRNFPTLLLAARTGRPFAYETYRPWMDQFPALRGPFRRAMSQPHFLGAVLHSRLAFDRYRALGVPEARLQVLHNGYDPSQFARQLDKRAARQALGLPLDRPIVTYAGHVNATKGLDTMLRMAARLPHVTHLLVGARGRGLVQSWAQRLPNVQVVPWQPFDKVVEYLWAADVLLQPPSRVPLRWVGNTILPMKLFLYLAAARPILAPDAPDVRELLAHDHNAVLVAPGDVEAAARAVQALLDDPERAARLGDAALRSAQDMTWDARALRLEQFLQQRLAAFKG